MIVQDIKRDGHCLRCGAAALTLQADNKRWACSACGFEFFQNPAAAVAGLIIDAANNLLLARRARDPHRGAYDLPGGFIDHGENSAPALCRELHEELNLIVQPADLQILGTAVNESYVFGGIEYSTVDIGYLLRVPVGCALEAADDVASLEWQPLATADQLPFAFTSMRPLVRLAQQAVQEI